MSLIRLENISKFYSADIILEDINFQINKNEKVGVVGVNGSGKTTLLKLITGDLHPDKGVIHSSKNLTIGYLSQHVSLSNNNTLFEEMSLSLKKINSLKEKMNGVEDQMAIEQKDAGKLTEFYGELQHEFELAGGYNIEYIIDRVLSGLGFSKDDWEKKVDILSGGQKSRVILGKIILEEPDLILLDEPTNHLDIYAVEWLENFLHDYSGAVVIVSHDRYFLDRVATKIAEIENANMTLYNGNYTGYINQKSERILLQEKMYNLQKAEIEDKQDFIRRNIAGQKTKQAQSRRKELEKMPVIKPPSKEKKITIDFKPENRGGNDVLVLDDLSMKFGEKKLFENFDLKVDRKQKIGIIGANGTGKTTLLKIITGKQEPSGGFIKIGSKIDTGYYDQHLDDLEKESTVIDEVWKIKPALSEGEMRKYLSRFMFFEDDVFLKISVLSGGEKSRVSLSKIMLSKANFLILDEPTNHLDIYSRMALEDALKDYDGTILTVSHDRYFLDRIVSKIIFMEEGLISIFDGNYTEFEEKRREEKARKKTNEKAVSERSKVEKKKTANVKVKRRKLEEVEKEIIGIESELKILESEMSDPDKYNDFKMINDMNLRYNELNGRLSELYDEWDKCSEK